MRDRSTPPPGLAGLAVALALAAMAVALAGCGGGASSAHTTGASAGERASPPTTRAQFAAQASSICRRASTQQQRLKSREQALRKLPEAQATKEFVSIVRQAAAISQAADRRLGELPRPPAQASQIAGLVRVYSQQAQDARAIASATAGNQDAIAEAAARALSNSIKAHLASAGRLGMRACFVLE